MGIYGNFLVCLDEADDCELLRWKMISDQKRVFMENYYAVPCNRCHLHGIVKSCGEACLT